MILKKTIEIEVYRQDLIGEYTWERAMEICNGLGDGWRLPTRVELHFMWENKDIIGGLDGYYYWSSSEYNADDAWGQDVNGDHDYYNKGDYVSVRPVRNVKQNEE